MIKFEDFKLEVVVEGNPPIYKWTDYDVQIVLEPCMEGMCVGIYDDQDWLLAEKLCTRMPNRSLVEVRSQAVALANILLDNYKKDNVIE